ncbi:MAG: hypothetical protein KF787_00845 [Phycisphaeraceae bacterium]|nr:hypothetical protein [Phycisphaerae bacterium]MBX3391169.1 hypothetical protein [Phycisphaeraceae bacterium]
MTVSILVILLCIAAGLAAIIGIAIQAFRHGGRLAWRWLLLPIGVLLSFAFIPASIGFAEGVWKTGHLELWMTIGVGSVGVLFQVLGWRAALRPRLSKGQCPACEYAIEGLSRCPECGRPCSPAAR